MYNPILEKRKELIDNIQKFFEFTENSIEKAKWQIGEVRVDSRGIAHECYEYTADGKPRLRRVKKNKDASTTSTDNSGSKKQTIQPNKNEGASTDSTVDNSSKKVETKNGKNNSDISFQLFDRKSGHSKYYEISPMPNELKNSSFISIIPAQESKSGKKEYVPRIEFKDGEKFSERLFSKKDAINFVKEKILENRNKGENK